MRGRPWWLILVLIMLVAAGGAGVSDSDALERNRKRLQDWRADPEHGARLMRDLRDFYALPAERQQQLRHLDAKLHEGDAATQARLWGVLERYSAWLDRLPEEKRREVLDAPRDGRLALIRRLREQEWLATLPAKVRAELDRLPPDARVRRIADLRADERRSKTGMVRTADLPAEVRAFIADHLVPILPREDKDALKAAEGKWPDYPRQVKLLTDRYLVLRPLPSGPVTAFKDLPPEFRKSVGGMLTKGLLKVDGGKKGWPEWAQGFTEQYRRLKPFGPFKPPPLPPLGASRPADYPPATRAYIEKTLIPALGKDAAAALTRLEGQWPEYPQRLAEEARRKGLLIPGVSLPGPRELWDPARPGP